MTAPVPQAAVDAMRRHSVGAFCGSDTACSCDRRWLTNDEWREHVAAAVVAAVQGPLQAQAWDEGYAAGRQDVQGSVYAGRKITRDNPYGADRIEDDQ